MPRIRTIKPEAPQHRKVGPLSDRAFRVWIVLLTQADDEGRVVCDPMQVLVWAFSYHRDVTEQQVEEAIQEVARTGLIRLYSVNGTRYAVFPSWRDHQVINRPTPSKLPAPPSLLDALTDRSMTDHGALTEDSRSTHAGSDQGSDRIKEGNGREGKGGDARGTIGEPELPPPPPKGGTVVPEDRPDPAPSRFQSGKCTGRTKAGLECVQPVLPGSAFCRFHQDQTTKPARNGNGRDRSADLRGAIGLGLSDAAIARCGYAPSEIAAMRRELGR